MLCAALLLGGNAGCRRGSGVSKSVTLYTSVDEPYAQPLVKLFEQQTGFSVTLVTDAEANKTIGLAERLRSEKDHPVADVWWDNECFLSARLAREGILAAYESPSAADIPSQYKDPDQRWAGSTLRVRVLVTASKLQGPPLTRLLDLARPDLRGRFALARPTAGTTGGHVAALYAAWGDEKADAFIRSLLQNGVATVGGNSVVADCVARGEMLAGLCDNDDAASATTEIAPLNTILPDQGPDEMGTLAMPCAVGLVAGAHNVANAKVLIDFLLSKQVDQALIDAKFAWCSARAASGKGKFMKVDYAAVAASMPASTVRAVGILDQR